MFDLKEYVFGNRTVINSFSCSRNADHRLEFVLKTYNGRFQKIGQSPSLADLQKSDIAKYRKTLGDKKSAEFTKAIGLSAHGVGIGSFVYLRRIFEDLVEQAHQDAQKNGGWDEEAYTRSRMAEKILLLKDHLPGFLVENRELYSILSVGVHSLTEEDCLSYFEPVKIAIELILDEKIEKQEKERKVSSTGKILAAIKSSFSSK